MPLDYSPRRPSGGRGRGGWRRLLLERVGLADRADHEPSQMSGGQQQRVAIARSLVNRPALVLADEPTGNLDSHTSVEILRMFQQLNAEGITVILVTHDPKVAAYAHRTIRIADGLIEGDERRRSHAATRHCGGTSAGGAGSPRAAHAAAAAARRRHRAAELSAAAGDGHGRRRPSAATAPPATSASRRTRRMPQARGGGADGDRSGGACRDCCRHASAPRLGALRRNKMRSALTALGVIIGVAAVIAMTEIGQGSKIAMQKTIASMGANNLLMSARGGHQRRRQLRRRQRADAHARRTPTRSPAVPGRQRRGPDRPRPRPGRLRQSQLDSQQHHRHHARRSWPSATGRTWTKATSSPTATSATAARSA